MATKAHCAFCFETLAASFERRQPWSLSQVEDLWEQYHTTTGKPSADPEDEEDEDEEEEEDEDAEMTDAEEQASTARPAAISRLLNKDASSSSSSISTGASSSSQSINSASASASGTATPASSMSSASRTSLPSSTQTQHSHTSSRPLFVTWNTISRSGHKSLRGCIGTFEAQPLEHGLASYALTSAFEDTRFHPIPSSLLPSLSNHVTLLTNFSSPTKDPLDWTLGKHGIRISFTHHGRRYGATYLPDVAKEQGWTKDETLISLMRKAGWNGSSSAWQKTWRDAKGELVRYEGKQVGLGYAEWKEWREWVESQGVKVSNLN